jgi:hypothetical protein
LTRVGEEVDVDVLGGQQARVPASQSDLHFAVFPDLVHPDLPERPVHRGEVHSLLAKLTFQDRDLMPQDEDLRILVPVAHRQ